MATAEAYDQWDDPGIAFTDEAVAGYEPKATAAVRINKLSELIPLVLRRSQLGEKPKWWDMLATKMLDCATWYCVASGLPAVDKETLRALPTGEKELRALTVRARGLGEPDAVVDGWAAAVRTEMVQHVTLGRRCAGSKKISGWTKADRSASNKIANALHRELTGSDKMREALASRVSAKEET